MYQPNYMDPALSTLLKHRGIIAATDDLFTLFRKFYERVEATEYLTANEKRTAWEHLLAGRIMPSTQLLTGATQLKKSLGSCTVIPMNAADPSQTLDSLEKHSILGEGVGIDLTNMPDPCATALLINRTAKQLSEELQRKNERPPAIMLTCSSKHTRSEEFCNLKYEEDLGDWVANISLKVESDKDMQRLIPIISKGIHKNGEPGVLFMHRIEDLNPNPELPYLSTAPCAETLLASDEQCIFVSVNIAAHVREGRFDYPLYASSCRSATRIANAMIDAGTSQLSKTTLYKRKIGIGVCGLHTALIYMKTPYAQSLELSSHLGEVLSYQTKQTSMLLAKRHGAYPGFSSSRWKNRSWRKSKYRATTGCVSAHAWRELMDQIAIHGIANSSTVCFPPTGVSSDILGVSKSYEPHFTFSNRQGIASRRVRKLAPEVIWAKANRAPPGVLQLALEIPPNIHLLVHEMFSKWSDDSGSKTINLPHETTTKEISQLLMKAWKMDIRGLTMFRENSNYE